MRTDKNVSQTADIFIFQVFRALYSAELPHVRKDSVRCLNYSALILKVKRLFLFSFSNFLDKSNMGALLRVILTFVFIYVGKEVP